MKHYWINIDECIVRNESIQLQFNERNIPNTRISAVTPSKLFNYDIKMKEGESISNPAEISCIISHLLAIKKGYDDGDNYFCITEDDIITEKVDFNKIFNYIEQEENRVNEKIEVLQLHTCSHICVCKLYNDYFLNNKIIIKSNNTYPSAAYYLISREGAKKVLDKYLSIIDNKISIDLSQGEWYVADNIIYISLNTYILTYPIIYTNIKLGSSIHPDHLINHENCNIIIKEMWEKNNFLNLFF
jgi:GR25 family glycosyltransferase involved in LPS biosynthesis